MSVCARARARIREHVACVGGKHYIYIILMLHDFCREMTFIGPTRERDDVERAILEKMSFLECAREEASTVSRDGKRNKLEGARAAQCARKNWVDARKMAAVVWCA